MNNHRPRIYGSKQDSKKKHLIGVPNTAAIQKYFASQQHSFTKSMKNIANAIQRHPDILKNNLLVNFSKTLDLGEASVMRFCKHLGFKGFTDFKKHFIDEFFEVPDDHESKSQVYDVDISPDTTPTEVLTKISNLIARITLDTKQALSQRHIELTTATEKIFHANRIFLFGAPTSRACIEETAARFTAKGFTVIWSCDVADAVAKSFILGKADVAIAVSCSGYNQDVIKVIQTLKKNRVYTIAITCDARSELALHTDNHFICFGNYDYLTDSIFVRTSQLFIFEIILSLVISFDLYRTQEHQLNAIQILEQLNNDKEEGPILL